MILILRFSSKKKDGKTGKNDLEEVVTDITIGLWKFDVIDGGILFSTYPEVNKKEIDEIEILSDKIKNLILVTKDSNYFRNDWSLSPVHIDDNHFYLYGFFTTQWHIVSIQLPQEFSNWLIMNKSSLIIFESLIQNINFDYLPETHWKNVLLKPVYDLYRDSFLIYKAELLNKL